MLINTAWKMPFEQQVFIFMCLITIYYLKIGYRICLCFCIGHGKFHLFLLLVCGFGMMGVVVENVNIGFVLPYVRCEMEISLFQQGLLNSVGYIGIVLSSHLWGFLADTTGRRRVLLISMAGSFISAFLSAFSYNIVSLILTRLFVGIL